MGYNTVCNAEEGATLWSFLIHVYDNDGLWVILFLGIAFVFYRLVWKVWSAAMQSKDDEIERLVNERDYYQSKVFPDLVTSDPGRLLAEKPEETK